MSNTSSAHKSKNPLAHIASSVVVFIHAYAKYDEGHSSYIIFTIAGIMILSVAIFHSQLLKKFTKIDGVFFIIEGLLSLVMAYDYFHMEKKYLPFVYIAIAIMQFGLGIRKKKIS